MSPVVPYFRAIVPAGGAGTRLWPLSRRKAPKFLLDPFATGRSLIQATWDRLAPLAGPDGIAIVTGAAHADAVRGQLPPATEVFTEPSPRDSMPAIGLAAAVLTNRHPNAIVGSFAADHVIGDNAVFADAVRRAIEAAREGFIVTVGVRPTGPSTAFGYIQAVDPLAGLDARRVGAFKEKPDAATARSYLAAGDYQWNAGMFVARGKILMDRLAESHPEMAEGLWTIARAWDTADRARVLDEVWPTLPRIAIDHAIAEPLAPRGGMAVVDGTFAWDDVGDWRSVGDLITPAADGARHLAVQAPPAPPGTDADRALADTAGPADQLARGGDESPRVPDLPGPLSAAILIDSPDALIASNDGRVVAVVGVPGAVIVDTEDALLITTRDEAQRVKDVVSELARRGYEGLA
ncbi:MAG: mannose-1-phosphate guanylyltransferase [Bifidobacteriaceae bacterium]|nr:mannose-1-phosphate guanylyltransferase [Bifidobacteriaceae bacterium]